MDPRGRPLLIVEAKIGHAITVAQIARYRDHQHAQLGPATPGVLLLLIPATRMGQASGVVDYVQTMVPSQVLGEATQIVCLALSWESCLDAISVALPDQTGAAPISVAADVAQLRSACETLGSWAVPINQVPKLHRSAFVTELLRQLKPRRPEWRWGPILSTDPDFTAFCYFGVPGGRSALSVGEARVFEADGASEIWFRVHKQTPEFAEVRRRLRRSEYGSVLADYRGHVWVPINTPADLGGPELVDSVVAQLTDIALVAAPPLEPETAPAVGDPA